MAPSAITLPIPCLSVSGSPSNTTASVMVTRGYSAVSGDTIETAPLPDEMASIKNNVPRTPKTPVAMDNPNPLMFPWSLNFMDASTRRTTSAPPNDWNIMTLFAHPTELMLNFIINPQTPHEIRARIENIIQLVIFNTIGRETAVPRIKYFLFYFFLPIFWNIIPVVTLLPGTCYDVPFIHFFS